LFASNVLGEPTTAPPEYIAQGAPGHPKVAASWNRYHRYAEATKILEDLAMAYPDLCRLSSLGTSYGGRQMWVLTITNFNVGETNKKTGMWIDGGIHANEIQATEVVLYTAWFLAESFGKSPFITRLLDSRTFYLMPMMSPDSRDAHFDEPNTTHSPRSGQRPFDDDGDGLIDEDKPDDIDGDGQITSMRRRDPHGRYKPHPKYLQWMVEVEPDEKGEYTLLGSEGIDNDGDGKVNEDGDGYYDPNRDWPWNWQPDYIQNGAHRYPFSILENRMVADFIMAHPNIAGNQSYHNTGGMILYGPGALDDSFQKADIELFKTIGTRGEKMLPGYKTMNIAKELYVVYGGEVDWLYAMLGMWPFTNELFTPFNLFRENKAGGFFANAEDLHRFDRYLLFGDGSVPWHEVDHPQYGKIEVGGFKKNWVRQPPTFLLEEECHRNMAFSLYHADQLPMVAVDKIDTRDLGQGLVEVTAVISNQRALPTHSAQDLAQKITRPDHVTISGNDITVQTSIWSNDPVFTDSKITLKNPSTALVANVPGMGATYVRWLVRGSGPYTVTVDSVKGGIARLTK
jgi:hypothetical protein